MAALPTDEGLTDVLEKDLDEFIKGKGYDLDQLKYIRNRWKLLNPNLINPAPTAVNNVDLPPAILEKLNKIDYISDYIAALKVNRESLTDVHLSGGLKSLSNLGKITCNAVKETNFVPVLNKLPFLTEMQKNELDEKIKLFIELNPKTGELALVSYISKILSGYMLSTNHPFALIDSQSRPWLNLYLSPEATPLKPDLFIAPTPFCMTYYKEDQSPILNENNTVFCGTIASDPCYDLVIPIDAKLTFSNLAVGDIANHDEHLYNWSLASSQHSILISTIGFRLYSRTNGNLESVVFANWVDAGSYDLFMDFISLRFFDSIAFSKYKWLLPTLNACTAALNFNQISFNSYLGHGATGVVFKSSLNGSDIVIKAMPYSYFADQCHRVESFIAAAQYVYALFFIKVRQLLLSRFENLPILVHTKTWHDQNVGGCFIYDKVGFTFIEILRHKNNYFSKEMMMSIFKSLFALHQSDIVHGDSRHENMICFSKELPYSFIWIDIATAKLLKFCPDKVKRIYDDVTMLCNSLLSLKKKELVPEIKNKINTYSISTNIDNILAVARDVYCCIKLK